MFFICRVPLGDGRKLQNPFDIRARQRCGSFSAVKQNQERRRTKSYRCPVAIACDICETADMDTVPRLLLIKKKLLKDEHVCNYRNISCLSFFVRL